MEYLHQKISKLQPELHFDVIANGSNLDDQSDYRPGEQAAIEFTVRCPLVEAESRRVNKLRAPVEDEPDPPATPDEIIKQPDDDA